MINFRDVFNPSYTFVGFILIAILIVLILLLNNNLKYSLSIIGKTSIIAGTITLVVALLAKLGLNTLLPYHYKIFVEVISDNVFTSCIIGSIISILIGIVAVLIPKKVITPNI